MARSLPVLFIHGPWIHASSWAPWLELYRASGYDAHAPRWPGEEATVEETRRHPERLGGIGYGALTRHFAHIIEKLDEPPILVGHSVGGHVVQKLHAMGLAQATIALAPVQFRGVRGLPLSQLQATVPLLRNPANYYRAISLTAAQFHRTFASELSQAEADALYVRYSIPSSVRPVFQTALANLTRRSKATVDTERIPPGPLLIVAGERDRVVPVWIAQEEARRYHRSPAFTILPGRGHSLVIDAGWREVAALTLRWLERRGLAPTPPVEAPAPGAAPWQPERRE